MDWHNLPPQWFYPALIPHITKLCIKYKSSIALITKANPAMQYGGLPFASKKKMFDLFPSSKFLPYILLKKSDSLKQKKERIRRFAKYPVILKPDTGHRGIDVKLIQSEDQLLKELKEQKWDYLLQEYCDYPYEFGVFYIRKPMQKHGHIESMNEKEIPILIGNGKDTIEQLIQKSNVENKPVLLDRHKDKRNTTLKKGEKFKTLVCAAHSRGAIFRDARRHITPQLTNKIDRICNHEGFHFGRLDVKTKSVADLKKGEFKIIEINGATSEMTHIWDANHTFKNGIGDLKHQWNLLFEIAAENKHAKKLSTRRFFKLYLQFFLKTKEVIGKPW